MHQRKTAIPCLWAEGLRDAEIHRGLSAQHGENVLPQRSVYKRIDMFKNCRKKCHWRRTIRAPIHSGYWRERWTVRVLILDNRDDNCRWSGKKQEISHSSAYEIFQRLHFRKSYARWAPKQLTEQKRHNNLGICNRHLNHNFTSNHIFGLLFVLSTEQFLLVIKVYYTSCVLSQ